MCKEKILVTLAILCLCLSATGQPGDSLINLKEVVVIATKTEKDISEIARSVSVITKEQIQKSNCQSVADLLSQQEGIYVVGNGQTPGSNQSLFLRGANSNQTTVLLDGVRINDASTVNNTIDLSELTLVDVEQIEIVRGSHGTLYGSSSIGGVINIVTNKKQKAGFSGNLALQGGTFGKSTSSGETSMAAAYHSKKGFYAKGFIDVLQVSGLDATVDTVTDTTVFKHRDMDDWHKFTTGLTSGFRNEKWNLNATYRYIKGNTDIDKSAYTDDDNSTLEFARNLVSSDFHFKQNENLSYSLLLSYTNTYRKNADDPSVVDDAGNTDRTIFRAYYWGDNFSGDAHINYKVPFIELLAGISSATEKMDSKSYYYTDLFSPPYYAARVPDTLNPVSTLNSYYLQADVNGEVFARSLDFFQLLTGFRYNHHSFLSDNYSYEINPSVKLGSGALAYVSWSSGFNIPSLYQLYAPETYFVSNIQLGNKTLQPEISKSFEVGFKQTVNDQFRFQVSYFNTVTEHVIDYAYLWDKNVPIDALSYADYRGDKYLNVGEQTAHGMELSLASRFSEKFSLNANVSVLSGKIKFNSSELDTLETGGNHVQLYSNGLFLTDEATETGLIRRPSTANIQFNYFPVKKLQVGCSLQYVNSRADLFYDYNLGPFGALNRKTVDEYLLTGFQANYSFNDHISLAFRMENVFDVRYEEIFGYTTRGRGGYLKLTCGW